MLSNFKKKATRRKIGENLVLQSIAVAIRMQEHNNELKALFKTINSSMHRQKTSPQGAEKTKFVIIRLSNMPQKMFKHNVFLEKFTT